MKEESIITKLLVDSYNKTLSLMRIADNFAKYNKKCYVTKQETLEEYLSKIPPSVFKRIGNTFQFNAPSQYFSECGYRVRCSEASLTIDSARTPGMLEIYPCLPTDEQVITLGTFCTKLEYGKDWTTYFTQNPFKEEDFSVKQQSANFGINGVNCNNDIIANFEKDFGAYKIILEPPLPQPFDIFEREQ